MSRHLPRGRPALPLRYLSLAVPGWFSALVAVCLQITILAQIASQFTGFRLSSVHNWALSFGLYFPIAFCLTLLGSLIGVNALAWYAFAAAGVLSLAVRSWQRRSPSAFSGTTKLEWSSVLIALAVTSVLNRFQYLKYGFISSPVTSGLHIDNVGHQFIINATQLEGAGASGYLSDWTLRYHWLSFLWIGQVEDQFALTPFAGLLFLLPWLSLLGIAIGVASVTRLLTRVRVARLIAPSLALVGQLPGSGIAENVNWDSVSQMTSGVILIGGFLLVLMLKRSGKYQFQALLLLTVLSFALAGTKISAAVILILATTGACLTRGPYTSPPIWRRLLPALAVVAGSLAGYWYFAFGQESGGLLRLRWTSATGTANLISGFANFDALSISIVLGTLFVLLPLLLTRKWTDQRTTTAINAVTLAVVGGLIPVLLLEPVLPNTTWFLTSALLIAIPVALAQAANTALPSFQASFVMPLIASSLLAVVWVLAMTTDIPVIAAQIVLLVVTWFIGIPILFQREGRTRSQRYFASSSLISVLLLGTLVPAEVIAARLAPSESTSSPEGKAPAIAQSSQAGLPSEIGELLGATHELSQLAARGTKVIVPPNLGTPALIWAAEHQLRPFLALPEYGAALGPQGSQIEVERRQQLTARLIKTGSATSLESLCQEGVEGIVQADERSTGLSPDFHILLLPCPATQ